MKTAELTGHRLNHLVAKALGWEQRLWGSIPIWYDPKSENRYRCHVSRWNPSEDWLQGGPIIERERIMLEPAENWVGHIYANHRNYVYVGKTALEAAMRCFVASKFGDDVPA